MPPYSLTPVAAAQSVRVGQPPNDKRSRPTGRLLLLCVSSGSCRYLLGCGVRRRYGFTDLNPFGNKVLASASFTAGVMMQS